MFDELNKILSTEMSSVLSTIVVSAIMLLVLVFAV